MMTISRYRIVHKSRTDEALDLYRRLDGKWIFGIRQHEAEEFDDHGLAEARMEILMADVQLEPEVKSRLIIQAFWSFK